MRLLEWWRISIADIFRIRSDLQLFYTRKVLVRLYVAYKDDIDREKILNTVESIFEKYNPGIPFEYTYFSDDFAGIYRDESQMLKLLFYFVTVAFLILCFGLYGLSRQVAIRKTKEIGIRKVNGASVSRSTADVC